MGIYAALLLIILLLSYITFDIRFKSFDDNIFTFLDNSNSFFAECIWVLCLWVGGMCQIGLTIIPALGYLMYCSFVTVYDIRKLISADASDMKVPEWVHFSLITIKFLVCFAFMIYTIAYARM